MFMDQWDLYIGKTERGGQEEPWSELASSREKTVGFRTSNLKTWPRWHLRNRRNSKVVVTQSRS